jgi:uncharacterized YccA/Bax inhibitor family protein
MRTSNPILNERTFSNVQTFGAGAAMTLQGTVNKAYLLLFLIVLSASYVWSKVIQPTSPLDGLEGASAQAAQTFMPLMMGGMIVGAIVALVTAFKKDWSPVLAPIYAVAEGLFLGGISAIFEMSYPGIVIQAIAMTFGTLFCLLTAYKSGWIKVTQNFRLGLVAATGAICLVYLINFIMSFFGGSMPFLYQSGPIGIAVSLVIVTVAALNLVLDFDFIEHGSARGLPKYMEWYAAFGLMVTLVWLYLEMLRLLAKLRDNR